MYKKGKPYSTYVLKAVKEIKKDIEKDPFRHKTAAGLLASISLPHRASVERAFKETYKVGIKEYQVQQRLEASKGFLEEGMTKKQVAGKCYYRSQSSYTAAFRKQFEMTPSQWLLSNSV